MHIPNSPVPPVPFHGMFTRIPPSSLTRNAEGVATTAVVAREDSQGCWQTRASPTTWKSHGEMTGEMDSIWLVYG